MANVRVKLDLATLDRLRKAAADPLSSPSVSDALTQIGGRMETFTKRRFDTYSRGGGDWKPLAESTIAARRSDRSGKTIGQARRDADSALGRARSDKARDAAIKRIRKYQSFKVSILTDTRQMRNGLQLGYPGNVRKKFAEVGGFGVRYGIQGSNHKGGMTIGRLAAIHHNGNARLPARKIVVQPDAATVARMTGDLRNAIRKIRGGAA